MEAVKNWLEEVRRLTRILEIGILTKEEYRERIERLPEFYGLLKTELDNLEQE
jgi:hypothetical protein